MGNENMKIIAISLSLIFLLVGCANKQILVGKKCFIDQEQNITTTTKSYVWFVDKNKDWSEELTKENCNN